MSSSKRRIFSNVSWNTATFVLQTFVFILATPIFVRGLGVGGFGIWTLISTFLGFNGVASLGLTDATIKFVAQYRARGDVGAIKDTISTTLAIYIVMGLVFSILVALLSPILMGALFKINSGDLANAVLALQIGAIGFFLKLFDSFFGSVIQAYDRYDRISQIDLWVVVGMTGVQVFLLSAGFGLISFVVVMVASTFVSAVLKFLCARRLVGIDGVFVPSVKSSQFKTLFHFGFFTWLQGLNGIIFGQMDRLLVASLLGTEALGYYAVCNRAASMIQLIPARATAFLFPLAAYQYEKGDLTALRKVYFTAQNLTMAVAAALGVPLVLFSQSVLSLWIDPAFASQSAFLLQILTIAAGFLSATILPYYYLNGAGFVRLNTLFGWAGSAVTVGALFFLLPAFGVVGAALSRLVAHCISLVCYPVLHRRVFGDRRIYVGVLVILPVVVGLGIPWALAAHVPQPPTLIGLFFAGGAATLLGLLVMVPLSFLLNPPFGVSMKEILEPVMQAALSVRARLTRGH